MGKDAENAQGKLAASLSAADKFCHDTEAVVRQVKQVTEKLHKKTAKLQQEQVRQRHIQ